MSKRIFKKRILMIAGITTAVNGISTFYRNLFDVFNETDVCVDILNVATVDKGLTFNKYVSENNIDPYGVIGNVVNIWSECDDLKKRFKQSDEMFPFLTKVGVEIVPTIPSHVRLMKLHQMFQTNIYDAIFNNDSGYNGLASLFMYYPFHKMIDLYEYTHNSLIFYKKEESNNIIKNNLVKMQNNLRNTAGEGYTLISQWDNDLIKEWGPNINTLKIGMLLECEKFHEYQLPEDKKEDRVLYIGRMDKSSKNPELWFRVMGETGLPGLCIVPSAKNAEEVKKLAQMYNISDCEVYHSLSFDEKLKQSARCKCFFIPSKHEAFGYTVYENMNLMPVVASDVYWSHMDKRELPYLRIPNKGQSIAEVIVDAVKNYSHAQVEEQYQDVIRYRNETRAKWIQFLNTIPERRGKECGSKDIKFLKLLETHKTLPSAVNATSTKSLGFEEIDILYRYLDPSKVLQTKEKTYYGEILEDSKQDKNFSLDAFFPCKGE